jgi:hypothetical protein
VSDELDALAAYRIPGWGGGEERYPYLWGKRLNGPHSRSGQHEEVKSLDPTGIWTPSNPYSAAIPTALFHLSMLSAYCKKQQNQLNPLSYQFHLLTLNDVVAYIFNVHTYIETRLAYFLSVNISPAHVLFRPCHSIRILLLYFWVRMASTFALFPGTELKYGVYASFAHKGQNWGLQETSCLPLCVLNPESAWHILMKFGTESWRSSSVLVRTGKSYLQFYLKFKLRLVTSIEESVERHCTYFFV